MSNLIYIQVMSEEDDDDFLVEALKSGAFLVLKKPLTVDVIMLIQQHIIRETLKHEKCKNKTMSHNVATRVQTNLRENRSCGSKRKKEAPQGRMISQVINPPRIMMFMTL